MSLDPALHLQLFGGVIRIVPGVSSDQLGVVAYINNQWVEVMEVPILPSMSPDRHLSPAPECSQFEVDVDQVSSQSWSNLHTQELSIEHLRQASRMLEERLRQPTAITVHAWRIVPPDQTVRDWFLLDTSLLRPTLSFDVEGEDEDISGPRRILTPGQGIVPEETVELLVDLAKQGNREDFMWLAASAGVPEAEREELWEGTRKRLGQ